MTDELQPPDPHAEPQEHRSFWRKKVREELTIVARETELIGPDEPLACIPRSLTVIVGALSSELTDRAVRAHLEQLKAQRPDAAKLVHRKIRSAAWDALKIHRGKAPTRAAAPQTRQG